MSSTPFDHVLITRFNTRLPDHPDQVASAEWVAHRWTLFETICAPSVARQQAHESFRWLVFFDSVRSAADEAKVLDAATRFRFEPIWLEGPFTFESAGEVIASRGSRPWLLTTRVDNDDAIADGYLAAVRAEFHEQDFEFVNFQNGVQWQDGRVHWRADPSNAFLSLIERRRPGTAPRTVMLDWHNVVNRHGPLRQVVTAPMWLQVIHGRNLANKARGIPVAPSVVVTQFGGLELPLEPVSTVELRRAQAVSAVRLGLRVLTRPSRLVWLMRVLVARLRSATGGRRSG